MGREGTEPSVGAAWDGLARPSLDAIVLAGGSPAHDAELLRYAGGVPCKALIPVGGRPILDHVLGALLGSGYVRRVVVAGMPAAHHLDLPDVAWIPDAGGILENGRAAFDYLCARGGASERMIVSSSDLPLITPAILRNLLDMFLSTDADLCYPIVRRQVMEQAFPGSGRTFVPLREGYFAGGDIDLVRASILDADRALVDEILGARKSFWRQIRVVGLDILFLFLIRRLTLSRIERRVHRVLGITGKAFPCPYPEVAMDIDKPRHLDVVRAAWARRQQAAGSD